MITYSNEAGTVCAEDVIDGLFAGWPHPPTAQQLIDVMDNSYARVWAFSDGRVIGYVNALSDGILTAFIPWLEVHPDYQGQGIGSELLRRILGQLGGMYSIDLMCDPEMVGFYERFDMSATTGALLRRPGVLRRAVVRA